MAQADGVVSNGSGAAVRSDINLQLAALFTNHSGPTSPTTTYAYQTWADTTANQLKIRNGADSNWIALRGLDGTFATPDGSAATPSLNFASDTNTGIYKYAADTIGFSTDGTYRMLIGGTLSTDDGGPSLLWKTTTNPVENAVDGIQFSSIGRLSIGNFGNCLVLNRHTTTGTIVGIRYNQSNVGSIVVTQSATGYNTSSDYRLKENVVALTDGKTRLNQLRVNRFNFIVDPTTTVDGFMAHEVADVVPEAITGTKDEVDSAGNPVYQGIDQAKLVPLLTAALQEAFAEIAALTTRIETLEAG
nr:Endo-N-acetylneuraminidase [uncultured Mediterranean phage uvMED]